MATKVQLSGGNFQDASGNVLADGYILMSLSQDGQVNADVQIAAGAEIKILLDGSGNVQSSPAQSVWPNDVISPANTFYTVSVYAADGQLVWGPNAQQVFSTPSPFDIGAWVPGQVNTLTGNVVTYDIGVFIPDQPAAGQVVGLFKLERAVRFASNFSPSTAVCGVNPTGVAIFTVSQNSSIVASIAIQTNGSAVFTSSGASFSANDLLTVIAPASVDATLANIGIILSGTTSS